MGNNIIHKMVDLTNHSSMKMIPLFRCTHMGTALNFYTRILDFKLAMPDASANDTVVCLQNNNGEIMLTSLEGDQKIGIAALVVVQNIDQLFEKYRQRGLDVSGRPESLVHQGPINQSWGTREFYVTDTDGNTLRFVQRI